MFNRSAAHEIPDSPRSQHVANVNGKTLGPILHDNIDRATHLMTDDAMVYPPLAKGFAGHSSVNHSAEEYVRLAGFAHTNTVENYFSILKRGIIGTYHHVSEAHLHRYLADSISATTSAPPLGSMMRRVWRRWPRGSLASV